MDYGFTRPLYEVCPGALAGSPGAGVAQFGSLFANWAVLSTITIVMAVGYNLLLYFLNQVLRREEALAEFRYQLYEAMVTFAIVVLAVWLVQVLCPVNPQFLLGNSPTTQFSTNIFQMSLEYLLRVRTLALETYKFLLPWNVSSIRYSTVIWNQRPAGFGIVNQPFSGLTHFLFLTTTITTPLILAILSSGTLYLLVRYILLTMLPFIFPIGVLLRCMQVTKKFGGMLIALALGLTFGLPMLFSLNSVLMSGYFSSGMQQLQGQLEVPGPYGTTSDVIQGLQPAESNASGYTHVLDKPQADAVVSTLPQGSNYEIKVVRGTFPGLIMAVIFPVMQIIVTLFLAGILLPTIDFLLIVTFVRELSRLLGEEVDISKLTQLI